MARSSPEWGSSPYATKPERMNKPEMEAQPLPPTRPSERETPLAEMRELREAANTAFQTFFENGRVVAETDGDQELAAAWKERTEQAAARARIRERLHADVESRVPLKKKLEKEGAKLPMGKNRSFFVKLVNGRQAVEKPQQLESVEARAIGNLKKESQMDRELLVETLADLFNVRVPATVEVETPHGRAARIAWIDLDHAARREWRRELNPMEVESAAILDAAIENMDRHNGNFGIGQDERLYCFDHGLSLVDRPLAWQRSPFLAELSSDTTRAFIDTLPPENVQVARMLASRTASSQREAAQTGNTILSDAPRRKVHRIQEAVLRSFLVPTPENEGLHATIQQEFIRRFGAYRAQKRWERFLQNIREITDAGLPPHLEPNLS